MQQRGASIKSKPATSVSFSQLPTHGASRGAQIVKTTPQLREAMITCETEQKTPVAGHSCPYFLVLNSLKSEQQQHTNLMLKSTTRMWIDQDASFLVQRLWELPSGQRLAVSLPCHLGLQWAQVWGSVCACQNQGTSIHSPDHRLANLVTDDDFQARGRSQASGEERKLKESNTSR